MNELTLFQMPMPLAGPVSASRSLDSRQATFTGKLVWPVLRVTWKNFGTLNEQLGIFPEITVVIAGLKSRQNTAIEEEPIPIKILSNTLLHG